MPPFEEGGLQHSERPITQSGRPREAQLLNPLELPVSVSCAPSGATPQKAPQNVAQSRTLAFTPNAGAKIDPPAAQLSQPVQDASHRVQHSPHRAELRSPLRQAASCTPGSGRGSREGRQTPGETADSASHGSSGTADAQAPAGNRVRRQLHWRP